MTEYVTIQGDMWDSIAYKALGSETYMPHLMKANPDHARIAVFSAGVVLQLPVVPTGQAATSLPPWKRVSL
ncbi:MULTISPECIES: tail protein X [Paenibacillus]|uniref:tail protein X n=1 Tax=Paenibacillus TaxID=44249 RepID=UPI0022B91F11|nr:tail protein X [Paenibacillus caseinilyticus]MCZ8520123.1 tail protein X [Paenibacillus caseinilyticus]